MRGLASFMLEFPSSLQVLGISGFAKNIASQTIASGVSAAAEITLFQLAAFLASIGTSFKVDVVETDARCKPWVHCFRIECKACIERMKEDCHDQLNRRPRPSFTVYGRYSAQAGPIFVVVVNSCCPETRALWSASQCESPNKPLGYSINCQAGVESLCGIQFLRGSQLLPTFRPRGPRPMFEEGAVNVLGHDRFQHFWLDLTTDRLSGDERKEETQAPDSACIQLEYSFKCAKPFVYCLPQAIRDNEAVPLGFIVTPTESAQPYDWFCRDLPE
jgi:hypothetical protein